MAKSRKEGKEKASIIGRCERCGKMVVLTKFTLCYECRQDEKAEVDRVLEYLKLHRGATLPMIALATGINPTLILKLIRGGRVETKEEELKRARERKRYE